MAEHSSPEITVRFETEPSRYRHWKVSYEGPVARVIMDVAEAGGMRPGYELKLNSYDLGVDIELADIVQRMRFEHPEVSAVVLTGPPGEKVFCAGANIYMLGASSHAFKVNFCKFTNETRLSLEEACDKSAQHWVAALSGVASGGGYELALACEEILLSDDGNSAVSFPETPLLAVLPGTGGLTRLVDKRKVRRDLADVFSTLAEGVRGKRAKDWGLVDGVFPRSKFDASVAERVKTIAAQASPKAGAGLTLPALMVERSSTARQEISRYSHVTLTVDRTARTATITVSGPSASPPASAADLREHRGGWHLTMAREFDDALLDLRFNHPTVGVIVLKTVGDTDKVLAADAALARLAESDWLAKEILLHLGRTLKRLDMTARSIFAVIEPGSCFAGSLFELAVAADRSYMLEGKGAQGAEAHVRLGSMNFGALPMGNGLSRLQTRFLAKPGFERTLAAEATGALNAEEAMRLGLVTFSPDDIDWDDEVRMALEERASLSPDALTGMEANLRFAGPETLETKIFARLTAWQNWIFQRANAVGPKGALTLYGHPERPEYDWRRT